MSDVKERQLLNCPFCDAVPTIDSNEGLFSANYQILCTECGASSGVRDTWDEVKEAWNARIVK